MFSLRPLRRLFSGLILPPQVGRDQGRLTVVLDLDETLCHTFIPSDHAGFQYQPDIKEDGIIQVKEKKILTYVYKRPGLDEFLEKLDKEYEPVVYSTGTEEYTNQVMDIVDPKGIIRHRLNQNHCVYERAWSYPQYEFMKDIKRLRGDARRVVVIDDDWQGMYKQPDNFIWVEKFEAFYQDDMLKKETPEILAELKDLPDVRPYLRARYMLKYSWAASGQLFQLTQGDREMAEYLISMDLKDYPQIRSKYYQVFGLEKKLLLPSELW